MRQFNGHVLFKLPPSQLQTAQHARKGKVFHSWHSLTQTYFLLSLYMRTRAHLIHTISSTSLYLNNLRDRWVSIGSLFLILHLLYNTLLTCIYLSSLHTSWLWTNTFIRWVLEWLRALRLHWPPLPAKVWVLWNSLSAPYLISLILSTMPLSSYLTNYLSFSIPSLFGLVDDIIKFKGGHMSNMCLPHQSDTSPYGYLFTSYPLLWLDDIHLCFYWLIRLLIYLSSYLLICLYLWLIW